jgi:ribosomal protein L37E
MDTSSFQPVVLCLVVIVAFCVVMDAVNRGKSLLISLLWGAGTFFLLCVFLPMWILTRPPMPDEEQAAVSMTCPQCGTRYPANALYCSTCTSTSHVESGQEALSDEPEFEQPSQYCVRCGRPMRLNDAFCSGCGLAVNNGEV